MVTVRELAEKMEVKSNDVIKKLMGLGIFATINQRLDQEAASIVATDFGFELKVVAMYKEEEIEIKANLQESPDKLKLRSPVVTIMGHVDHGKTSLLDAIREARVAEGEAGGITQHIGAYKVQVPKGQIVFLDTPGHEAFTAMRARGAKVTDIVVLVVSATDGVMPQTIEAMDHAKAAGVPIIVAVNKIDLPGANPQKIRQELANHGLQPEEWGGKTIFQDVSAKKRINLDKLLELIALQAEILELKANPERPGHGVILEARLDPKRGSVATLLVQAGTVKVGDAFVAGLCYGKVKALVDDLGNRVDAGGPSTPVEVLGIMGTPQAGDVFSVVSDDRQARDIAEKRKLLHREQSIAHQKHMTLVGLKASIGGPVAKDLNLVIKADVQGSMQALKDSLEGMATSECRVRLIHAGIGNANESDILLASASDAVVMLFHTDIEPRGQELAGREGVEVRKYEIIYDLIADVKAALEGLLAPEIVDVVVGKGEVREVFPLKGGGKVAGCFIREGKVVRGGLVRLVRGGQVAAEGKITTLKRFKDDVKEVEKNLECGLTIDGVADYAKGDQLEFIVKESRTRRLSESPQQK
jgi:translation initiation factor IF-2